MQIADTLFANSKDTRRILPRKTLKALKMLPVVITLGDDVRQS